MVPPRPHRTSFAVGFFVRVCSDGGRRGALGGEDMTMNGMIFGEEHMRAMMCWVWKGSIIYEGIITRLNNHSS